MRGMQDTCPDTHRNVHIYVRMLHDACLKLGGPSDAIFLLCLDLVQRPAVAG
jgi:hypothetical protein